MTLILIQTVVCLLSNRLHLPQTFSIEERDAIGATLVGLVHECVDLGLDRSILALGLAKDSV